MSRNFSMLLILFFHRVPDPFAVPSAIGLTLLIVSIMTFNDYKHLFCGGPAAHSEKGSSGAYA